MSCTKKVTCYRCGGEGKITIYESENNHRVAVFLNDGREYERFSKRITCPVCDGRGKIIDEDHDFDTHEAMLKDWLYVKCKKCGGVRFF